MPEGGRLEDLLASASTLSLKTHAKTVVALSIDPRSAHRMLSGSRDGSVALWDFGSMQRYKEGADDGDAACKPYRVIEPVEGAPVRCVAYNVDGTMIMTSSGAATVQLFDREAVIQGELAKGDQYIRDMRQTSGHVAAINGMCALDGKERLLTWADDGTVRCWDVVGGRRRNLAVLPIRGSTTARLAVKSACVLNGGIYSSADDGCLRLFPEKGPWTNTPRASVGTSTFDTLVAYREHFIAGRSEHGVSVFDVRALKQPLCEAQLPRAHEQAALVHAGGSLATVAEGRLRLLSDETLAEEPSGRPCSAVALTWHPRLQQLFTGNPDGSITAVYSPEHSRKGVMLALQRPVKELVQQSAFVPQSEIITPLAPEEASADPNDIYAYRRANRRQRTDPLASHRPDLPIYGFGHGGRIGSSITQSIMQQVSPADDPRGQDPREALLAYAEAAEKNPRFVAPAYRHTQPRPVYSSVAEEEVSGEKRPLTEAEEDAVRQAIRRRLKPQ